jgi:hypothetical protein
MKKFKIAGLAAFIILTIAVSGSAESIIYRACMEGIYFFNWNFPSHIPDNCVQPLKECLCTCTEFAFECDENCAKASGCTVTVQFDTELTISTDCDAVSRTTSDEAKRCSSSCNNLRENCENICDTDWDLCLDEGPITINQAYNLEYNACMSYFWDNFYFWSYGYSDVGDCVEHFENLPPENCLIVGERGLVAAHEVIDGYPGLGFYLPTRLAEFGSYTNEYYEPTCHLLNPSDDCACPTSNERVIMNELLQDYCGVEFKGTYCKLLAESKVNCFKSCMGNDLKFDRAPYRPSCQAPFSWSYQGHSDSWDCSHSCEEKLYKDVRELIQKNCKQKEDVRVEINFFLDPNYILESIQERGFRPHEPATPYDDVIAKIKVFESDSGRPIPLEARIKVLDSQANELTVVKTVQKEEFELIDSTPEYDTYHWKIMGWFEGWTQEAPILHDLVDGGSAIVSADLELSQTRTETVERDVPVGSCVHLWGDKNAKFKIAYVREKGTKMTADELLSQSKLNYEFLLELDPIKSYKDQFAFYVDLKEIELGLNDERWTLLFQEPYDLSEECKGFTQYNIYGSSAIERRANEMRRGGADFFSLNGFTRFGARINILAYSLSRKDSLPSIAAHEMGHSFALLDDEATVGDDRILGTNCKHSGDLFFPYGEINLKGCTSRNAYKPSGTSLMNYGADRQTKFNVISCAYFLLSIQGRGTWDIQDRHLRMNPLDVSQHRMGADMAQLLEECMAMDTLKPTCSKAEDCTKYGFNERCVSCVESACKAANDRRECQIDTPGNSLSGACNSGKCAPTCQKIEDCVTGQGFFKDCISCEDTLCIPINEGKSISRNSKEFNYDFDGHCSEGRFVLDPKYDPHYVNILEKEWN